MLNNVPKSSTVLSERVYYKNREVILNLNKENLEIKDSNTEELLKLVNLDDVAGVFVEEPYRFGEMNVKLIINSYHQVEKKRKKITNELTFCQEFSKAQNLSRALEWKREIYSLIKPDDHKKPFLVFVNPNSGSGKASRIFLNHTASVWNEAELSYRIVETLNKNFAFDFVRSINTSDYRGIIVISGDGLVHEVINGLMSRQDWKKAIKLPIGQIPAGSANGLACSTAFLTNEEYIYNNLEEFSRATAFNMSKSTAQPLDLISIQLSNNKFVQSFINVEWAIVADVDYESEKFRFLGSLRFLVGAISRVINLRIYKARMSFLPSDSSKVYIPKDPSVKILKNIQNPASKTVLKNHDLNYEYKYLKPFNEPVPSDWLTIEDDFVLFLIVNLPLMGADLFVSSDLKYDDGEMVLAYVKKGIPRLDVLKLLDDAGKGRFLDNKYLEWVKIKAFRLEPLDSSSHTDGNVMIDGEKMPYGRFQGECMPQIASVLSKRIKK